MSIDPGPLTAAPPEEVQRAQTERLLEAWKTTYRLALLVGGQQLGWSASGTRR